MITIALSKGRILKETLPILKKVGISISDDMLNSRQLILDSNHKDIKIIVLRATDVPIFIKHGAADLGVAGKDVLLEQNIQDIYELLDLNIAKCRLMVAAQSEQKLKQNTLKVATKYAKLTTEFFNARSQQIELIKLYGAMELAPMVNLSHCIVDLVDTGNTLKANGLKEFDHILDISARLIVNSAVYKTKNSQLTRLVNRIEQKL